MSREIIKNAIIDPDTGEVIKENVYFRYDGFNDKGYKYRYRAADVKFYPDSIPGSLSAEAWFLLVMIAELTNDENVLVYRVERKSKFSSIIYKPYDKEEIRKQLRYPYGINKFDRCWLELRKHCIKQVRYHDYLVWCINPAVINKCKQIPPWLYDEFSIYMNPYMTKLAIRKYQKILDDYEN